MCWRSGMCCLLLAQLPRCTPRLPGMHAAFLAAAAGTLTYEQLSMGQPALTPALAAPDFL